MMDAGAVPNPELVETVVERLAAFGIDVHQDHPGGLELRWLGGKVR